MHVTSLGAAREIQEGIAVDPLLVGCGVKPHDFDFAFQNNQTKFDENKKAPKRLFYSWEKGKLPIPQ